MAPAAAPRFSRARLSTARRRLEGKKGSGMVCLNGPAARLGTVGDEIIIITYAHLTVDEAKNFKPKTVLVDKENKITKII